MASRKLVLLAAAVVFLLIAAVNLYRMLVGFPIEIAGHTIGMTISFFALCIGAALSILLFLEARR